MPIFDQGYQHWKGALSGHAWRWLAITRHGVRAQMRNWIVRVLLLVAWLPALALAAALALWGLLEQRAGAGIGWLDLPPEVIAKPQAFRSAVWTIAYSFFFKVQLVVVLLLVLVVGPNLISRDLRFNALPLYFSRPLRRVDYFLGKLGVIGFFLAAVAIVPAVGAFALGVCFSLDLGVVKDTYRLLGGSIAYGLLIIVSAGTLMLALSSLSRRSIYVGIAWAGWWLISVSVSTTLLAIYGETLRQQVIEQEMTRWVQEHPPPPAIQITQRWYYSYLQPLAPRRPGAAHPALGASSVGLLSSPSGPRALLAASALIAARTRDEEGEHWMRSWSQAYNRAYRRAEAARATASRRDWRPLVSYATNLDRIGDLLLDTDSAWVVIGRAIEQPRDAVNERLLADLMVWQYPWVWSAGVLAGVLGLSLWILTSRVKSLDRLR